MDKNGRTFGRTSLLFTAFYYRYDAFEKYKHKNKKTPKPLYTRLWQYFQMVRPSGVEPPHTAPEAAALSTELRAQDSLVHDAP